MIKQNIFECETSILIIMTKTIGGYETIIILDLLEIMWKRKGIKCDWIRYWKMDSLVIMGCYNHFIMVSFMILITFLFLTIISISKISVI